MDGLAELIASALPESEQRGRFDLDTAFARQCIRDAIRQLEAAKRHLAMTADLLPRDAMDHAGSVADVISDIEFDISHRQARVDAAMARCQR